MTMVPYGSNGSVLHSPQSATTLRNFVLKVDCEQGRILYASSSIKEALSFDENVSLSGCSIESLLHPDDIEDFMLYCRCPADYISCLPQITKGSISATSSTSSFDSDSGGGQQEACQYVTFLCRMVTGAGMNNAANDRQPQYTVVRVSGKQQVDEQDWEDEEEDGLRIEDYSDDHLNDSNHLDNTFDSDTNHQIEKRRRSLDDGRVGRGDIRQIFFSLVEVPTVSLKLELTPSPEHFSVHEYMLSSDQSPTILFADPRIERILGFTQVEVVGRTGYDFVMPKDQLFIVAAQFDAVLKCREPVPVAARLKTKNGKVIFTRSRVYLNLDHWTRKIKNYVTISSVISKRTAFKYFQRQIRTVSSLRKNKDKWSEMLNLLELTEEQKSFVSKMDLKSYLEDFRDCLEQHLQKSSTASDNSFSNSSVDDAPIVTEITNLSSPTSADINCTQSSTFPTIEDRSCRESSLGGRGRSPNHLSLDFCPVPYIEEVLKFFPTDFATHYKVRPSHPRDPSFVSPSSLSPQLPVFDPTSPSQTILNDPTSGLDGIRDKLPPRIPGTNSAANSACNVVDSLCKHSLPDPDDSGCGGISGATCFRTSSLVRSLLGTDKNENVPSSDFSSLMSSAASSVLSSNSVSSTSGEQDKMYSNSGASCKRGVHLRNVRVLAASEMSGSSTFASSTGKTIKYSKSSSSGQSSGSGGNQKRGSIGGHGSNNSAGRKSKTSIASAHS
ncbi:uncharacterized protein LOC142349218 [Convolutriloba macropyga]|uniref:uncharacterized protein LOC142349218 n=1 Tax=Convolutriloba macropyga TaxID=536237 RepID=UPI003F525916